jgi:hypothetical protein
MSLVAPIDELIADNLQRMRKLLATIREEIGQPPSASRCKYLEALLVNVDICKKIVHNLMEMKKSMLATEKRIKASMET